MANAFPVEGWYVSITYGHINRSERSVFKKVVLTNCPPPTEGFSVFGDKFCAATDQWRQEHSEIGNGFNLTA